MLITASSKDRGREGKEDKLMIQCFYDQIFTESKKTVSLSGCYLLISSLKIREVVEMVYRSQIQKASKSQATASQAHMQSCLEILQNMER